MTLHTRETGMLAAYGEQLWIAESAVEHIPIAAYGRTEEDAVDRLNNHALAVAKRLAKKE